MLSLVFNFNTVRLFVGVLNFSEITACDSSSNWNIIKIWIARIKECPQKGLFVVWEQTDQPQDSVRVAWIQY